VECLEFQKSENQEFWKEMQHPSQLFDDLMASVAHDILGIDFLKFLQMEIGTGTVVSVLGNFWNCRSLFVHTHPLAFMENVI
jgi:hypothetical protein